MQKYLRFSLVIATGSIFSSACLFDPVALDDSAERPSPSTKTC